MYRYFVPFSVFPLFSLIVVYFVVFFCPPKTSGKFKLLVFKSCRFEPEERARPLPTLRCILGTPPALRSFSRFVFKHFLFFLGVFEFASHRAAFALPGPRPASSRVMSSVPRRFPGPPHKEACKYVNKSRNQYRIPKQSIYIFGAQSAKIAGERDFLVPHTGPQV